MEGTINLNPILVVEDDERVLEAITEFLVTVGYPVNAARTMARKRLIGLATRILR